MSLVRSSLLTKLTLSSYRASDSRSASALVQNFLDSLKGASEASTGQEPPFATLSDLLSPSITVSVIESATAPVIDHLLSFLPPSLLLMAQEADDRSSTEPNAETVQAAIRALSMEQKREILIQVLRSPQFHQSLGSLTVALRDGGLPSVSDALGIKVRNGGFMKRGAMPLGGGEAVEAFVDGVRKSVEDEEARGDHDRMETDG